VLAIARRVLMEDPPYIRERNADVLKRFEETIFRLLKKNIDERFRNMEEVCFHLQQARRDSFIRFKRKASLQTKQKESLEQLKSWLRDSRRKREGNVVLIPGEQGIGKSLLVASLCGEMSQEGVLCLKGFADDSAETYPYYSFRDLFRNYCRLDETLYHSPNLIEPFAKQMPQNHTDSPINYCPLAVVWQDNSGSKRLQVQSLEAVFCIGESPELEPHQYEFRFFFDSPDAQLHAWVDGKMIGFFGKTFPRPDGMWFGNFQPVKTSLGWSDFRVDWVEIIELE
jgi:hypothetical protein